MHPADYDIIVDESRMEMEYFGQNKSHHRLSYLKKDNDVIKSLIVGEDFVINKIELRVPRFIITTSGVYKNNRFFTTTVFYILKSNCKVISEFVREAKILF